MLPGEERAQFVWLELCKTLGWDPDRPGSFLGKANAVKSHPPGTPCRLMVKPFGLCTGELTDLPPDPGYDYSVRLLRVGKTDFPPDTVVSVYKAEVDFPKVP